MRMDINYVHCDGITRPKASGLRAVPPQKEGQA